MAGWLRLGALETAPEVARRRGGWEEMRWRHGMDLPTSGYIPRDV